MSTTREPSARATAGLGPALVCIALVVAVVGSLGAPLITAVAADAGVSLNAAQWTLTITLFAGAIAGPVLGRLGSGPARRATILMSLAVVVVGSLLTVIPLPFGFLLIGRALQGVGVGVVPLLMGVARTHLPEKSTSTIAALSVASTVGIGVGYPLVGLIDQFAGLRAAYGVGCVLATAALVVAWRRLPREASGPRPRVDVTGALLLAAATLGILFAVAEPAVWTMPWVGGGVLVISAALLAAWVAAELRIASPLVDVRLLRRSSVLRANIAMLLAGVGMYLLFSLLTRFLQTPAGAGYGFALSPVMAGAALIPFSALGFVAGKVLPGLVTRISSTWAYAMASGAVVIATVVFAFATGSLWAVLVAMAVLGFGVGGVSAVMPGLVLADAPLSESASVLTINQIIRSIGFSIGSALAGLLLATGARTDALPTEAGYATAAFWVIPFVLISALVIIAGRRRALPARGSG